MLVDNVVYTAPEIRTVIGGRGQITGDFTLKEVRELINTLRAETLPLNANLRLLSSEHWVAGEKPPHARVKYSLLISIAAIMVIALAISCWAIVTARLNLFGMLCLLLAVSVVVWWAIVAWNNYAAKHMPFVAAVPSIIVFIGALLTWIIAARGANSKDIANHVD